MRDLVVGEIKDSKSRRGFKAGEVCDRVVGKVEFFQFGKGREAGDVREAI